MYGVVVSCCVESGRVQSGMVPWGVMRSRGVTWCWVGCSPCVGILRAVVCRFVILYFVS